MTTGPKRHQQYHSSIKDTPRKMLHPNEGGPTYRTAREAFGTDLAPDHQPQPMNDTVKGWLIFLAIIAVTLLACYIIHPHWKP